MQLEELIEKIHSESKRELDRHRQEYEQKSGKLRQELEAKKNAIKSEETARCTQEISREKMHAVSSAEVFWHKKMLGKKRETVDEAIEKGILAFRSSEEYKKFISSLLASVPAKATIYADKDDKIVRQLAAKKKQKVLAADFAGGIAYSAGNAMTVLSVESFLEENRAFVESEMKKILFEGN